MFVYVVGGENKLFIENDIFVPFSNAELNIPSIITVVSKPEHVNPLLMF
jgi:hypothetical protein